MEEPPADLSEDARFVRVALRSRRTGLVRALRAGGGRSSPGSERADHLLDPPADPRAPPRLAAVADPETVESGLPPVTFEKQFDDPLLLRPEFPREVLDRGRRLARSAGRFGAGPEILQRQLASIRTADASREPVDGGPQPRPRDRPTRFPMTCDPDRDLLDEIVTILRGDAKGPASPL